jgi:hypothetical protein
MIPTKKHFRSGPFISKNQATKDTCAQKTGGWKVLGHKMAALERGKVLSVAEFWEARQRGGCLADRRLPGGWLLTIHNDSNTRCSMKARAGYRESPTHVVDRYQNFFITKYIKHRWRVINSQFTHVNVLGFKNWELVKKVKIHPMSLLPSPLVSELMFVPQNPPNARKIPLAR